MNKIGTPRKSKLGATMTIVAPNPTFLHVSVSPSKYKDFPCTNLNPSVRIQLPLYKPNYKPPRPIKVKPPPRRNSDPKPITTTSDILHLMDSLKLPIPLDIYTSLVKECTQLRDPLKAIELHQHIRKSGIRLSLPSLNRLLLMYISSGCFEHARHLFDQMPVRDFNSWAVIIAGSVENAEYGASINLFISMVRESHFHRACDRQLEFSVPGILVCALKSCLCTMDLELGRQLHGWLWKMGYSRNVVLSSFLINFYGKLKCLEDAKNVFDHVSNRNTVVWTSRIVNCCSHGSFEEAVSVFKEMASERVRKNGYTFSSVLKACGRIGDIQCGQQVHANVLKLGLESDSFVQCALIDLYGKCGLLKDATRIFDMGGNKENGACCNAMLTNYAQHGLCTEANEFLSEMKLAGFQPNESLSSEINLFSLGAQ